MTGTLTEISVTPAQRKQIVDLGWQKILAKDQSFHSYLNSETGANDFGTFAVVATKPGPTGLTVFERTIDWGPSPTGDASATYSGPGKDPKKPTFRALTYLYPPMDGYRPGGQDPSEGPYGRVGASFGKPGKRIDLDRVSTIFAINLYHELLHERFRFEDYEGWPANDRPYHDFFQTWTNPPDADFQKRRAAWLKKYPKHQVEKWFEEKFCINQAFGKFGFFAFNEEIAIAYGRDQLHRDLKPVEKKELVDLFDALDRAHGVRAVNLPANVPVELFYESMNINRTKDLERKNSTFAPRPPEKPISPEEWDRVWNIGNRAEDQVGFVNTPLPDNLAPGVQASQGSAPVKQEGGLRPAGPGSLTNQSGGQSPQPSGIAEKLVPGPPVVPSIPLSPHSLWSPWGFGGASLPSSPTTIFRPSTLFGFTQPPPRPIEPSPIPTVWRPTATQTNVVSSSRPFEPGSILGNDDPALAFNYRPEPGNIASPPPIPDGGPLSSGGSGWDNFASGGGFFGGPPKVDEPVVPTPEPPPEPPRVEQPIYRPPDPPDFASPIESTHIPVPPYVPDDSPFTQENRMPGPTTGGSLYPPD